MPVFNITSMLFPGGKGKALTLSYDDGVTQDRRLVALLNEYGVKGTFNLNSALLGQSGTRFENNREVDTSRLPAEEIPALYRGHEIATHGAHHAAMTGRGPAAACEVLDDRRALEALCGTLVRGHAYPFGLYDPQVLAMLRASGICYARTVRSTNSFALPENFLAWDPTCHHNDPELMALAERFCTWEPRYGEPQLFYLWGHAYEFDIWDNWDVIGRFLERVADCRDKIWMASNLEICEYLHAFGQLVFSADGARAYNPTAAELWLRVEGTPRRIPAGETVTLK